MGVEQSQVGVRGEGKGGPFDWQMWYESFNEPMMCTGLRIAFVCLLRYYHLRVQYLKLYTWAHVTYLCPSNLSGSQDCSSRAKACLMYLDDSHKNPLTFPAWVVKWQQEPSPDGSLPSPLLSDVLNLDFCDSVAQSAADLKGSGMAGITPEATEAQMTVTPCLFQLLGQVLPAPSSSKFRASFFQSQQHFLHVHLCTELSVILCRQLPFYIGLAAGNAGNHTGQKQKDT